MDKERLDYALANLQGVGGDKALVKRIRQEFNVDRSTAVATVKRAYELMAAVDREDIRAKKSRMRLTYERIAADSMAMSEKKKTTHGYTVALKALQEICKIDGLYAPELLEVNDKRTPVENMTPEERRKEMRKLLLKREEAGLPPIEGLN